MLEGDGIRLRALEPEDVELLYSWENDMKIWEVSNTLTPFSKYQLKRYIESSKLSIYQTKQLRLIIEADDGKNHLPVGMIDLFDFDPFHNRGGVGIIINSRFRGKGYARKALMLFVDYCFGYLKLHQLYASITEDNEASISLFKSVGFEHTGTKLQWRKSVSGYKDELFFQKING
ncbi:MAG: GNAT family N-acetyltransferase [Chlorobi bacterium]|nr:GNAT family N-acetyltransferase [Chlorobiota bacterium]